MPLIDKGEKKTILIVDDMPQNLDILLAVLADHYVVVAANNGEKALQLAQRSPVPDLILLDIMMPGLDGYEVCRRLKADVKTVNIPVIFLTSLSEEVNEVKGLELGAVDYIAKPISPPLVLARIATQLALSASLEQLRLFAKAFEYTSNGMLITAPDATILQVNPAFSAITGYSGGELVGHNPRLLSSGRHDAAFYKNMWQQLTNDGHWEGEVWNRRSNGEVYPERLTINALYSHGGKLTHYLAVISDISEEKKRELVLLEQATQDGLTGLPNRTLMRDRLQQAMWRAQREGVSVALLFIDLDRFKPVNDDYGHAVGDEVLCEVAERMHGKLRNSDTLARIGGDEFVVIAVPATRQEAAVIADKLLDCVARPYQIGDYQISIGCSIGIGCDENGGGDIDVLLKGADAAMYRAKQHGRNTYCFVGES